MANMIDVKVPDIGDYKDVPIIEILVKPGDVVKADQSLVTLESDKATMDVPAPGAGTVREIVAKVGDKVAMGSLILRLEEAVGAAPSPAPAAAPGRRRSAAAGGGAAPPPSAAAARAGEGRRPGARRLFGRVRRAGRSPSGARTRSRPDPGARHRRKGPHHRARTSRRRWPAAAVRAARRCPKSRRSIFPSSGRSRPSRCRASSASPDRGCMRSWVNVPHVTHSDEADVTDLDAFRKSLDDDAKADKKAPYRVSLLPLADESLGQRA